MSDRIDIADPMREICDRLGLEYTFVKELTINAGSVTATVFLANESGHKYVTGPNEVAAVATREFKVLS